MRVWFNRNFSGVHDAIELIREEDKDGRFHLIQTVKPERGVQTTAAHECHVEPTNLGLEAYLAWCLAFCAEHRIDIFVPGREATALAAAHERFAAQGTRLLNCSSSTTLALLHDKGRFYAETQNVAAPAPAYRTFTNLHEFDVGYAQLRARHDKLCVKPAHSVYGLGFAVIDEARSSAELLFDGVAHQIGRDDLRNGLACMTTSRRMLLMEYLDGPEWSVDCVGDHGRLVCAVPRKKLGQPGAGQLIEVRDDILAQTSYLATVLRLNGQFNVQYREHAGRLRLLEINPRMSGGAALSCVAGPNLPYIALRGFADGYDTVTVPAVRSGIRVAMVPAARELA